jgi:thioredoxin-related protein
VEKPFRILAVNMQEGVDAVKAYRRAMGLSLQMLVDATGEVSRLYGVRATPTHVLIDAEGRMIASHVGAKDWTSAETQQLVEGLLPRG